MSEITLPKIAEKIRFWEEQDKINQLLIPRVIELHEKVLKLSQLTGNVSELIAASESRTTEQLASLQAAIVARSAMEQVTSELQDELVKVKRELRFLKMLSWLGLGLSALAIILLIVRLL